MGIPYQKPTPEARGEISSDKVLQGCILKLLLHSVNSGLILYRIGNMQSAILLSFVASSSLPPGRLLCTHPPMSCCISPYVIYNVYGSNTGNFSNVKCISCKTAESPIHKTPLIYLSMHYTKIFRYPQSMLLPFAHFLFVTMRLHVHPTEPQTHTGT